MWKEMDDEQKYDITKMYVESGVSGEEFSKVAADLGIQAESLARYVRTYKEAPVNYHKISDVGAETYTGGDVVEKELDRTSYPRITDIQESTDDSDSTRWVNWLKDRSAKDPIMTVMHLCDMHEPFSHSNSINVAMQMVHRAKPDVIVVGSDFADFYGLGFWDKDPEVSSKVDDYDELDSFERAWNKFIHAVHKISPNSKLIWIYGNHERRIIRYLLKNAVGVSKAVLREFVRIIKCGGRVYYIGDVDHIRMGPLQVEHGNRYNIHAPKSRLEDEGHQMNIAFGHGHKHKYYHKRGADFAVSAIMSGCLCELMPHYLGRGASSQSGEKWDHGTMVATFDINDRLVQFENQEFTTTQKETFTFFRGERISSLPK